MHSSLSAYHSGHSVTPCPAVTPSLPRWAVTPRTISRSKYSCLDLLASDVLAQGRDK